MNVFSTRHLLPPLITLIIICLIWFLPIHMFYMEHVVISFLIFLATYVEYRQKPFPFLGFHRRNFKVKNLLVLAPLVAFGLFAFYVFLLVPGITLLTHSPIDYSAFDQLEGNIPACIAAFFILWASAGFGEEIIFRGFFMTQLVKFLGDSKIAIALNILGLAVFFGFMHSQQGITGQLVTGIVGVILALIFYLRNYDLWFAIAIHGFFDTYGLICAYLGLT